MNKIEKKMNDEGIVPALKKSIETAFGNKAKPYTDKLEKIPKKDNRLKAFKVVGQLFMLERAVKKNPKLKEDKRINDFLDYMNSKESVDTSKRIGGLLIMRNPPDLAGIWLMKMQAKLEQKSKSTPESQEWVDKFLNLVQTN